MKSPILGSTYVARSVNAADNRMVNLFPEINAEGGKEPAFLQRAPGLQLLSTVGGGPIRGMWQCNGVGYVVSGDSFYSISNLWGATYLGYVSGSGQVSISDNGIQIFIAANPDGFIYNTNTNAYTQITDPDFPGAVTVGYIDGYFVFNQPNSQKLWVTTLFDGLTIDPLDFASAEGSPDNLVALMVNHREIWLFGSNSVEVWYDAGLPDFPLSRIQGAFNELGCVAPYSLAKMDNAIFWLGADARGQGIVYKANGYSGERISTHAIEWQLQAYSNLSDAIGYTYQQDGHSFYVLTFPFASTTWVYDIATQAWHERGEWIGTRFNRHRSNCQMFAYNKIVVGDYQNGNIYAYDLDIYTDYGGVQKWLRSWRALPTGTNNLKRSIQHSLQLDCETGVGLGITPGEDQRTLLTENDYVIVCEFNQLYLATETDDRLTDEFGQPIILIDYPDIDGFPLSTTSSLPSAGYNPEVMLRWSDDGGHTWSNEHWTSAGQIGQYGKRAIWRRLGATLKLRDRVYEVSGTAPVKVVISGAELHLSPTNA